jgi:peptidoglycan/LPS O-acetylase OafA/YrhL
MGNHMVQTHTGLLLRETENTASTLPGSERNIPSLDGLRAVSIVFVLLAHSSWFLPRIVTQSSPFRFIIGNGMHGVAVFFVISGYLITTILLRELSSTHSISLRRFYFRRTLRIFPPYYAFLAVMGFLWAGHVIKLDLTSFVAAATYTWAVNPHATSALLTHAWSLSIEELFYLLWPLCLLLLYRKRRTLHWTIGAILFFPVLRLALYFLLPSLRGHEFYMVQGWGDTMLVGCALALVRQRHDFEAWHRRVLKGWMVVLIGLVAFYMSPFVMLSLPKSAAGFYANAINPLLVAAATAVIVLYLITRTRSMASGILNQAILRHIGVLSYSLYLWQQMFMMHQLHFYWPAYVYAFLAAETSFWLIERPSLRLRAKLESSALRRSPASDALTSHGKPFSYQA